MVRLVPAGVTSGYTDPVVIVRHLRPGHASCSSADAAGARVGCYTSLYMHMGNDTSVQVGETVSAGQLIGHSGASSATNYAHLHFEASLGMNSLLREISLLLG